MPRITFRWPESSFSTDCRIMAQTFAASPESFQPRSGGRITPEIRHALSLVFDQFERQHPDYGRRSASIAMNGVEITIADHGRKPPL